MAGRLHHLIPAVFLMVLSTAQDVPGQERLQRIRSGGPDADSVTDAVIVSGGALIWTTQYLPAGESQAPEEQLASCLEQMEKDLNANASSLNFLVRLNIYCASPDILSAVRKQIARHIPAEHAPVISGCITELPHGAAVAVDAVAASSAENLSAVACHQGLAVMPSGSRIFISGQAEQHEDLAEATRRTLQSLSDTLRFLKRSDADIVQLKAFVQPMTKSDVVRAEVEKFYGDRGAPPLVQVAWKSSATTPVEIEIVAWGGSGQDSLAEGLPASPLSETEYITPPGFTQSAVYCRVCRVNSDAIIFIRGMTGDPRKDRAADEEVRSVFAVLNSILERTGSSLKHLVKATYYVSSDPVSASLNKLRPDYYDPQRPPAASKAMTEFVDGEQGLMMDMIAVPEK